MADTSDRQLLEFVASNGGAITHRQLLDRGYSRGHIQRLTERLLLPVARGVYVVPPARTEAVAAAALLAVRDGAFSHQFAASRHGLAVANAILVEVTSIHRTRSQMSGVRFRTTNWLPDLDVSVMAGQRITSVERTICDLASQSGPRRLRHLVERAIVDQRCRATELQACVLSYRRRGREGSRALGLFALPILDGDPIPSSELERLAVSFLRRERVEGWVAQFVPPWHDGIRGVVDFAWPEQQLVLEVDGRRWHTTTQAFDEDRRRDQLAVAAGWRTIRAGWQQLKHRPDEIADALRAALASSHPARSVLR